MIIRTFDLNKFIQYLILLALLLTPIFSFYEVLALITGTLTSQTEALTPIYIKVMKDVFFALIILLSIFKILRKMMVNKYVIFFLFLASIIVCNICLTLISGGNYMMVLAGIRWSIPILLPFFLIGIVNGEFMRKIDKMLIFLFFLHFVLQIYQLFTMQFWFGANVLGLAARTPGIFMIPNTAAFFTVLCWFFFNYYGNFTRRQMAFIHIWTGISVLLTMSGAGIIVYILLLFISAIDRRHLKIALFFSPMIIVLLLLVITSISGRTEDYIERSGGARLQIFVDELTNANLLTDSFGIGTNTGVLFASSNMGSSGGKIVDSTYASMIANTGLLGFAFFIGVALLWLYNAMRINRQYTYSFTIIFGLFGATTIIFEAYPINLLFSICLAYIVSQANFLPKFKGAKCGYNEA